jgi:hypothetical protein
VVGHFQIVLEWNYRFVQSSRRHLKTVGARRLKCSQFHDVDPPTLGTAVQNGVAVPNCPFSEQKLAGSGTPPTTLTPPFLGLMVSSIMTQGVVSGQVERLEQKIRRKCHATE